MSHKIAIVWRGDQRSRAAATTENNRYREIFAELQALGIAAEPAVYCEEMQDEVRAQLMKADGALVWVNPLEDGRTREKLDALLREVAASGRFVSAHPDVILKMGVKEVLHRTKHLGWGTDTHLYRSTAEFRDGFPARLRIAGPRVIKQNRGNAGQGVWKVEWPDRRRAARLLSRCWRRAAAACPKPCRSTISCRDVRPISAGADASSISLSSRGCPTE